MNKSVYLKLFFLIAALLVWKLFYEQSCLVFIFSAFIVSSFLTLSFVENSLLYRKSVADVIFYSSSWMFRWLQSKWFVLIKAILQSIIFCIIFLIGSIQWGLVVTIVMGIDILIIIGLYKWVLKITSTHTKAGIQDIFARKAATVINMLLLTPILIGIIFYSPSPEFLDSSLSTSLLNSQEGIQHTKCTLVSLLYSYDLAKESFAWWSMMSTSPNIGNNSLLFIGWSIFLLFETMYVWIFSKLVLSTTINLNSIFMDSKGLKSE